MGPPLRRLLPFVLRYRRRFALGLLCVFLTTAIQLMPPWILKFAVDDLTAGVTRAKLGLYAGIVVGIAVVGAIFRYLMRMILIGASRDIEYDIRNAFFARLLEMPLAYYQTRRTGDLMSRATNDLNAVRMLVGPAVMYSANTALVFVVAIAVMVSIDVRLTLIALVPLPFVTMAVRYFGNAIHSRFGEIQAQLSDLSAVVQENLAGVRVVRAYAQEPHEIERFRSANEEYVQRNRILIRLQGLFYPSLTFFLGLGALLVLWQGGDAVVRGRISLGEFVAFNAYLAMLSWPMIAFGWVTNIVQRGLASWGRMLEVIDAVPSVADDHVTEAGRQVRITGDISIRDLTFTYPGADRLVLDRLSLHIPAGTTAAFVGPTGSGKSSLVALLPRLQDPPAGTILLDGVDVREIPLQKLRGAFAMVPQEPFLFSTTLAENITFGADAGHSFTPPLPHVSGAGELPHREVDAAIATAAGVARLDKDVESFPKGYETIIGERGITLSGGQKQRTALARALFTARPILVLDDALSAVDTYTEEEILTRLRSVMRQRTALIVAHRVSTVRDADQIFVLERGRIVERGRHDDLIALNGIYASLHRKQLLEEELEAS